MQYCISSKLLFINLVIINFKGSNCAKCCMPHAVQVFSLTRLLLEIIVSLTLIS